jgi:hypothetical protein
MIFKKIFYAFVVLWFAQGQCQHNVILEALDAPSGAPQFTIVNCGSPVGYLADGLPANSADIAAIQPILVNVTVPGPYNFTTNTINGVIFSATGTFTNTGTQTVNLIGSGIPTDYTVDNNTIPYSVSNVTATNAGTCSFTRKVYVPDQNYTGTIRNDGMHRFLYKVITFNGKEWLQTNLGAHYNQVGHPNFNPEMAATGINDYLAFGSLFQVGRNSDGHELMTWTSATSGIPVSGTSTTITANSGQFYISSNAANGDYYAIKTAFNGHFIVGPDIPCPSGFYPMFETYTASNDVPSGSYNAGSSYWINSPLKLVAPTVYRNAANGNMLSYGRRLIRLNNVSTFPNHTSNSPQFVIEGGAITYTDTFGVTAYMDRRFIESGNIDRRGQLDGYPMRCVKNN